MLRRGLGRPGYAGSVARRPAPIVPLLLAAACVVAMAITATLALAWAPGHERDAAMLHGFVALDPEGRPRLHEAIVVLAGLADPLPYATAGLALVVVALRRGRPA